MKQGLFLFFVLFVFSVPSFSCNPYLTVGSPYYNPTKYLDYIENQLPGSGLTEQQYFEAIAKVKAIYDPIIQAKGGILDFPAELWKNNDVNGTVNRHADGRWTVEVFGGYARHRLATLDSLYFIICHELGHHLGETIYYADEYSWASGEGQADYYSTTKCMRHILEKEDNESYLKTISYPLSVLDKCERQFSNRSDQLICIRGAMAGHDMTNIWDNGRPTFSFDTPSQKVTQSTYIYHPDNQCRIDTYLQGALCEVVATVEPDKSDYRIGNCNTSTGHAIGARPACWFNENDFLKPLITKN